MPTTTRTLITIALSAALGAAVVVVVRPLRADGAAAPAARTIDPLAAPAFALAGGQLTARLLLDQTAAPGAAASMTLLTAQPGAASPAHAHEGSDELVYVLSGRAVSTSAGVDHVVGPGMVMHLPASVSHDMTVPADATEPLVALVVYAAAGPEQRFRSGTPLTSEPGER